MCEFEASLGQHSETKHMSGGGAWNKLSASCPHFYDFLPGHAGERRKSLEPPSEV